VGNPLNPRDGMKGKFGDDSTVENRVEHGEESGESEADHQHRFHFYERQVSVVRLQFLLLPFQLFLGALVDGVTGVLFFLLQLFTLFFYFIFKFFVLVSSINEDPRESLAGQRRRR